MYLGSFEVGGTETVIEYDQLASWLDWKIERPRENETILDLGKITLMHTRHRTQRPLRHKLCLAAKSAAVVVAVLVASDAAEAHFNISLWVHWIKPDAIGPR